MSDTANINDTPFPGIDCDRPFAPPPTAPPPRILIL